MLLHGWSCGHRWVSPSEVGRSNPAAPPREHRFQGQRMKDSPRDTASSRENRGGDRGWCQRPLCRCTRTHELTPAAQESQVWSSGRCGAWVNCTHKRNMPDLLTQTTTIFFTLLVLSGGLCVCGRVMCMRVCKLVQEHRPTLRETERCYVEVT